MIRPFAPGVKLLALMFLPAALGGCSHGDRSAPSAPRPLAGDRVTPSIDFVAPWKAGAAAHLNISLQAEGAAARPVLLRSTEAPEKSDLHAAVIFYRGEEEIERREELSLEWSC
jgi:hypothetical protein